MSGGHTAQWFIDQRLVEAARRRDLPAMREAVHYGANPDSVMDEDGLRAPLIVAHAMLGNFDVVLELLSLGANPNGADAEGFTALLRTVQSPGTRTTRPVVGALVAAGADVNATTGHGRRALDYAVENLTVSAYDGEHPGRDADNEALVRFLVENGAASLRATTIVRVQGATRRERSR
jgi:hypothetical protein